MKLVKDELTIQERFEKFHNDNPHVYEALKRLAFEAKQAGKNKIGVDLLVQVARWELIMNTDTNDKFKISNSYTSRYARLMMEQEPELEGLFELRTIRTL